METDEGILKGDGQTMADVKIAVGVWWWHNDRVNVVVTNHFTIIFTVAVVVDGKGGDGWLENAGSLPRCINV